MAEGNLATEEDSDIPFLTIRTVKEEKSQNSDMGKISQCFICDLFTCEPFAKPNETRVYYRLGDYEFRTVKVRGIVTDKDRVFGKVYITVDDATAAIECVFTANPKLDEVKAKVEKLNSANTELENHPCNILNPKFAQLMLTKMRHKLRHISTAESVRIGDTVEVVGDLYNFRESRGIMIINMSQFARDDCLADVVYIEKTLLLKNIDVNNIY